MAARLRQVVAGRRNDDPVRALFRAQAEWASIRGNWPQPDAVAPFCLFERLLQITARWNANRAPLHARRWNLDGGTGALGRSIRLARLSACRLAETGHHVPGHDVQSSGWCRIDARGQQQRERHCGSPHKDSHGCWIASQACVADLMTPVSLTTDAGTARADARALTAASQCCSNVRATVFQE